MTLHWTHDVAGDGCARCKGRGDELVIACGRPLLVLSLWQPWATLVVAPDPAKLTFDGPPIAPKTNETRHWKPRLELPYTVVIHGAKRYDAETRDSYTRWPFKDALERCGFFAGDPRPLIKRRETVELLDGRKVRPVPLGALVGLVDVVDVLTTEDWLTLGAENGGEHYAEEQQFGNYGAGRYAWRLANPVMFAAPIPFSGRQEALYPVDERTRLEIRNQLQAA